MAEGLLIKDSCCFSAFCVLSPIEMDDSPGKPHWKNVVSSTYAKLFLKTNVIIGSS